MSHPSLRIFVILCQFVIASGMPLYFPTKFDRTDSSEANKSERFPCENCACGCGTADHCWRSCCCHTSYRGGEVFFCCNYCASAFEKNPDKFSAAANKQLVASGQATQTRDPITGEPLVEGFKIAVGGVAVQFASEKNLQFVLAAEPKEQVRMVFDNTAFDRSFAVGDVGPVVEANSSDQTPGSPAGSYLLWGLMGFLLAGAAFLIFVVFGKSRQKKDDVKRGKSVARSHRRATL